MASKKNKYDLAHLSNLSRYSAEVEAIYRAAVKEAAKLASTVHTPIGEDMFSFADYPQTKKRVDALLAKYRKDMMKVLVNGVDAEWTLANNKNNDTARQVFGKKADTLTDEQKRQYFTNNDTAREAFKGRSVNGLNLSDRVWNFAGSFKKEIEMGVDLGLRKGQSASEMARDLQKFLKHPDELYRRVRDEHGVLKLSQAAKDFHPGRGVYRSSYKNALRLAITETNMAYRIADWERWQTMDFVVGIRIQLSGNHTCLGSDGLPHPFKDICDELAGDYPKSFKWTGWHPQCRCNAVPILKTVQERKADMKARLAGGKASKDSVNAVKKLPRAFNEWLERNKDRIAAAKSQPYFIRDNAAAVDKVLPGVLPEELIPATIPSIVERAIQRHANRMGEQVEAILTPRGQNLYVAFEPFSPAIKEYLNQRRDRKDKLRLFDELLNDKEFELIHKEENGGRTVCHPQHKTKNSTWEATEKMAYALNRNGKDVVFLPEHPTITSADALLVVNGFPRIVDFKYSTSTKWNTLQKELAEGFTQAGSVVLKIENMDAGQFREAIDYMKRKKLPLGDMLLLNKYDKVLSLSYNDFRSGKYRYKIKGFL